MSTVSFKNPTTGRIVEINNPEFFCSLFGPFYFVAKGIWVHAVVAALLIPTVIYWVIYPFFVRDIIEMHYLQKGWIPVTPLGPHIIRMQKSWQK